MSAQRPASRSPGDAWFGAALALLVLTSVGVQAVGAWRRNVHWDEFIVLANVHAWLRGDGVRLLQTGYVHLLAWLPGTGLDEVAQVQAGRALLLGVWLVTLALAGRLALRLSGDRVAALAAAAVAASLSENLVHGASLRVDGLLAAAYLGACLLAHRRGSGARVAAGVLSGLLVFLSVKSVLLLPVVVGLVLVARGREESGTAALLPWAGTGAATAAGLTALHAWAGAGPPGAPLQGTGSFLGNAGYRMLVEGGAFPRVGTLLDALVATPPAWGLLAVGVGVSADSLRHPEGRARGRVGLLLAAPLLLFTFYRNLWPYALVSLLPTLWVVAGVGWAWLWRRPSPAAQVVAWAVVPWLWLGQGVVARDIRVDGTRVQRQTLEVVHTLFPEPVPYVARVGSVPSFPRPLFNMTTFGLETYRARGVPEVSRYVARHAPPFLLMDASNLALFGDPGAAGSAPRPPLLPEDARLLSETYAPFWGLVYLAGRRWPGLAEGEVRSFTVYVPGPYTLWAPRGARVDGTDLVSGGTVWLDRGPHRIEGGGGEGEVALFWGEGVVRPAAEPLPGPFYHGF